MTIYSLSGAVLLTIAEANLRGADLSGADLHGANLRGADLREANLRGADLREANLRGANLCGADLQWADLPSPSMILLASWGTLPDDLTTDLMTYDATNHPNPELFDAWAKGGLCPYDAGRWQRAANFRERRECWVSNHPVKRPYDLLIAVFKACGVKYE